MPRQTAILRKGIYLKAPFTGVVTAKLAERGASALPGAPAFTLMKTDFVYA